MKDLEAKFDKNPFSIINRYSNTLQSSKLDAPGDKNADGIVRRDSIHNRYTFKLKNIP